MCYGLAHFVLTTQFCSHRDRDKAKAYIIQFTLSRYICQQCGMSHQFGICKNGALKKNAQFLYRKYMDMFGVLDKILNVRSRRHFVGLEARFITKGSRDLMIQAGSKKKCRVFFIFFFISSIS